MSCCYVLFVYDLIFQYVIGQTREKIYAFAYTSYVYVMLTYIPYGEEEEEEFIRIQRIL